VICGRIIQSGGPLCYAIVDGLNVRDGRAHEHPSRRISGQRGQVR
jgi:hypothetical protein